MSDETERNVCRLSAGDMEMIADGETVGPWLFGGEPVYVEIDDSELDKVRTVDTDTERTDNKENTNQFTSRQFLSWIALFTVGFVASVLALEAIGVPTTITFVAGIAFGEIMDIAVDPFTESYVAENKENTDR